MRSGNIHKFDEVFNKEISKKEANAIFIMITLPMYGQSTADSAKRRSLIITAINSRGEIFIGERPIPRIEFDEQRAWDNLEDSIQRRLGKARLSQLFDHSQMRDTTYWTNEELDKGILVKSRSENVDVGDVISKFHLTEEQQINTYKRKISQFNATDVQDKNIYYFSRPVFDDSCKFAIIKWDNGHSWLGGGGAIELYQLLGEEWHYLARIAIWRY